MYSTDLHVNNLDIALAHTHRTNKWHHRTPTPTPMRMCWGATNSFQWLARVSTKLSVHYSLLTSFTYMYAYFFFKLGKIFLTKFPIIFHFTINFCYKVYKTSQHNLWDFYFLNLFEDQLPWSTWVITWRPGGVKLIGQWDISRGFTYRSVM